MLTFCDVRTGEVVGYLIENNGFSAVVSEKVGSEILGSLFECLERVAEGCIYHRGRIYRMMSLLYEVSFEPDTLNADEIWIDGYVFTKLGGIAVDDEFAIKRLIVGHDIYM